MGKSRTQGLTRLFEDKAPKKVEGTGPPAGDGAQGFSGLYSMPGGPTEGTRDNVREKVGKWEQATGKVAFPEWLRKLGGRGLGGDAPEAAEPESAAPEAAAEEISVEALTAEVAPADKAAESDAEHEDKAEASEAEASETHEGTRSGSRERSEGDGDEEDDDDDEDEEEDEEGAADSNESEVARAIDARAQRNAEHIAARRRDPHLKRQLAGIARARRADKAGAASHATESGANKLFDEEFAVGDEAAQRGSDLRKTYKQDVYLGDKHDQGWVLGDKDQGKDRKHSVGGDVHLGTVRDQAAAASEDTKRDVFNGGEGRTERLGLSMLERESRGWGLLPMVAECEGHDKKGRDVDIGTPEAPNLEHRLVEYLHERDDQMAEGGTVNKLGREDYVIKLDKGAFVKADGSTLDTKDAAFAGKFGDADKFVTERAHFLALKRQMAADKVTESAGDKEQEETWRKKLEKRSAKVEAMKTPEKARAALGGRYIYVMNAAGDIFAGQSKVGVMHHSSFLAGGAVAGAGEIQVSGGKLKVISNCSGHYRPGPGYLWQVIKQIVAQGVDPTSFAVECAGLPATPGSLKTVAFKTGADFIAMMEKIGGDGQINIFSWQTVLAVEEHGTTL